MFGILIACFMLVVIPIVAVQYPRYIASRPPSTPPHLPSFSAQEANDTGLDGAGEASRDETDEIRRAAHAATTPRSAPAHDVRAKQRKPWDPPFATSPRRTRQMYRVLAPSSLPAHDGDGEVADRLHHGFEGAGERADGHAPAKNSLQDSPPAVSSVNVSRIGDEHPDSPTNPVSKSNQGPPQQHETHNFRFPMIQTCILALISVISIFAFAILTAHCLAWFIVYKTESRLGEARKGLLKGGDMRLCLCARG